MSSIQTLFSWELLAVILAVTYLLLAIKERIECWYAAFASTAIYTVLFWDVNLLMESALQIYYLLMAVYGWRQWHQHKNMEDDLKIHCWPTRQHLLIAASLTILIFISGYLLSENTNAALPYLDSLTTWGAVIATYMVTQKILENWLYWIVIDSVSIYLYIDRDMHLTTLLFILYVIIAIIGYFQWRKKFQVQ